MVNNPLLSIIIPTSNRPHFLPRAIDSALSGMDCGKLEVIVIPNGKDQSWKQSLQNFNSNPAVRVLPIDEPNANIARNIGLISAKGDFIRFLDDDDYLLPEGSRLQYELLQTTRADVICGAIDVKDPYGEKIRTFSPPHIEDFCEAISSPLGFTLLHAFVYRRKSIIENRWNPKIKNRQDLYWLVDICKLKEIKWVRIDEVVGVWQHHWGNRITLNHQNQLFHSKAALCLLGLFNNLKRQNRLTANRRKAISNHLWFCFHAAFCLKPKYWTKIAKIAHIIDPQTRPSQCIYNFPIARNFDPIFIQWLIWPIRHFRHLKRELLLKQKTNSFWSK